MAQAVMTNQASTTSASSRSRASTAVLESSDRGTPAPGQSHSIMAASVMTPAASLRDGESGDETRFSQASHINKFAPFQSLMETEITLEFGKGLKESKIVHEEMLRCHSAAARTLFDKAKNLRERYSRSDQMRKNLKNIVSARVLDETFDERAGSKKALPLIIAIYNNFPFKIHCDNGQQVVDDAIADQVRKNNVTSTQPKNQIIKDIKGMDVQTRMSFLDARGIFAVAQCLSAHLKSVKNLETKAAHTNPTKAAAQRRYILPDVELRVVRSLMDWMYCGGRLSFEDAEHLYMLHSLATRLGITALAELCLGTLSSDAESDIEAASSRGLSLQQALGFGSSAEEDCAQVMPMGSSIQVIFAHVLADASPPKRLISLITTTLAESLNPSMWTSLAPMMNHAISLSLIQAMVDRKQVKEEEFDQLRLRHEGTIPKSEPGNLAQNAR